MSFFSTLSGMFNHPNRPEKKQPVKKIAQHSAPASAPQVEPVTTVQPGKPIQLQSLSKRIGFPTQQSTSAPQMVSNETILQTQQAADALIREAQARSREIIVEAKDEALQLREKAEKDARQRTQDILDKERSLDNKLSAFESKLKTLDDRETELKKQRDTLEQERQKIGELREDFVKKLEKAAGMTKDQAKQEILQSLEREVAKDSAQIIQAAESAAKETADEKAREILVDAMKHGATEYVAEYTVSTVKLPDDEVKGRIIGKDGRNIRAFEMATGVDVDLDDQPGQVRLSCFDPVRREIARITLERLVKDGRIQPTRIDETVKKVTSEIQKIMFEEGKKLCYAVGVYNLPAELMQTLGRFKYRFSYGQNLIAHTLEETKIGAALAKEVGAHVETVKLGCLLHDIGKVVEGEEGSHVEVGVNYLKKFRLPQAVVDCVEQHHEDKPFSSVEAVLTYVADAISGARPGARYENYDEYVKRLSKLEEISKSYEQVREAYAIQAGREIRVILKPDNSSDADVTVLAHKIKDRVQNELTYPGTVTVTVIREIRGVDVAK